MLSLLPRAVPVIPRPHSALVHSFITLRGLLLLDVDGLSVPHSPKPAPRVGMTDEGPSGGILMHV